MKTKLFVLICMLALVPGTKVLAGKWGCEITTRFQYYDKGPVTIIYDSKSGAVHTGGTYNTTVSNYLKNKVGKYVVTTRTVNNFGYMYAKGEGTKGGFYYYIVQLYEDKSYTSGSAKFTARVYKGAYLRIGGENSDGHSYDG